MFKRSGFNQPLKLAQVGGTNFDRRFGLHSRNSFRGKVECLVRWRQAIVVLIHSSQNLLVTDCTIRMSISETERLSRTLGLTVVLVSLGQLQRVVW
jgi:hypothetical protein